MLRLLSECDGDHWQVLSKCVKLPNLLCIWRIVWRQENLSVAYFTQGERTLWFSPGGSRVDAETLSDSVCICLSWEGGPHRSY